MGKDHFQAAHEGTDEIGVAVAATTFSIVAVFVPVGFMSGFAGQWFKPFALTIACAVLVSLFVSFSLDPMLSAYWPDPQIEAHERRNPIARAHRPLQPVVRPAGAALPRRRRVGARPPQDDGRARGGHRSSARSRCRSPFGGFGFTPESDRSELTVTVEAPPGSSLEYTRAQTEQIATQLRTHPEVRYTYSTVGSASGSGAVDAATIYVRLKPKAERDVEPGGVRHARCAQELRRYASRHGLPARGGRPGRRTEAAPAPAAGARRGDAHAPRRRRSRRSCAQTPGAVDVGLSTKGQKPELRVAINRGLAGTHRRERRADRAGAAPRVRRRRRRQLGRPERRDALRARAAAGRSRARTRPTSRASRSRSRRRPPAARPRVVPLGQVATIDGEHGPRADRPLPAPAAS